jgi:hypothetical protein
VQPKLTVDTREFESAMRRFARATGQDAAKILRDEAGLLSMDLARVFPPFNKLGGREAFSAQRRTGHIAVRRDILAVIGLDSSIFSALHEKNPEAAKRYWGILNSASAGGTNAARAYAETILGTLPRERAATRVDPQAHRRMRRSNGRVAKGRNTQPQQIVTARARQRYIKEIQAHVGYLKAGWALAAIRYRSGRGIPSWIARMAATAGTLTDGTTRPSPFVQMTNTVRYASLHDRGGRLTRMAIANRARAMEAKIRAALRTQARRAS